MNRKRFITVVASLSVFCMSMTGMNAVWARDGGSEKFDPQPVSSDWEQKDMKGTYAYFVSGKDWVGVYKYDADDDTPLFAKASDQYAACYETAYSVGSDLYVVKGFAKDVDDIGKVREMVESISYPGNPALDTQEGFDNSGSDQDDKQNEDQNSEAGETETSNEVNVDTDEDSGNNIYLETLTLVREDGSTFTITQQTNGDYCYRDDDGVGYTDNGDESYTDEYGNTYRALNDATHYLGITLEQHTLESSDGNTVTVTQTTNGDYYYRDDNGTDFTDNGDGTWTDENGNDYTEIN